MIKKLQANVGNIRDIDLIPGLGRSPRGRHDHPLQYSYLENPMDRGAWRATVHTELDMTEAIYQACTCIDIDIDMCILHGHTYRHIMQP